MAKLIQVPYQSDIIVPVSTAQAVQKNNEKPISLEALGLLVNLLSYPSTWELHKTELYKRFGKHGERSVKAAWNDLMESNYIIEFRYRSGKKYEYVYYFRKVPFTFEEKAEILDAATKQFGEIWGLQNEDPKMKTSKRRGNQKPLLKQDPLLNINNDYVDNIDDDKRINSSNHNEEQINLIISNFRQATKDELTDRSFKSVVRKVVDKYNQGKVRSFRDYLATALIRKIEDLELRRQKDNAKKQFADEEKQQVADKLNNIEIKKVPFYDWLAS
ncbi:hypothetical protein QP810_10020 [Streptococcus agalactiae]|uniref:hypothetical protein n=1 Tax=Streptococcus agalactiae TaxID=1311 RepID=UPI002555DEC6|nr:hypothetical protein [Streptococcus agalactiae]MDK8747560.1 hypothetical protein [Streptococcus agalactiae]